MMYRSEKGERRLAVASQTESQGEGIAAIDVADVTAEVEQPFPYADVLAVIAGGPEAVSALADLLDAAGNRMRTVAAEDVLPPLDPPAGNVLAIGRNYAEHTNEMARAGKIDSDRPTVFTKGQNSINGPFQPITIDPKVSAQVDWEAELGVVIGKPALNVEEDEAMDYVFGYTVLNDVSARDLQYGWGGQYFKGKSINGYCPVGPWILTADEVADSRHLDVILRVNGEEKQRGNTRDMIFSIPNLVSQLSLGMTLPPGTLIATGTPPGVGYARDPKEFLKPGDVMETEISGIGLMRNHILASEGGVWRTPRQPGG